MIITHGVAVRVSTEAWGMLLSTARATQIHATRSLETQQVLYHVL